MDSNQLLLELESLREEVEALRAGVRHDEPSHLAVTAPYPPEQLHVAYATRGDQQRPAGLPTGCDQYIRVLLLWLLQLDIVLCSYPGRCHAEP